jgi:hypothetical protein
MVSHLMMSCLMMSPQSEPPDPARLQTANESTKEARSQVNSQVNSAANHAVRECGWRGSPG